MSKGKFFILGHYPLSNVVAITKWFRYLLEKWTADDIIWPQTDEDEYII